MFVEPLESRMMLSSVQTWTHDMGNVSVKSDTTIHAAGFKARTLRIANAANVAVDHLNVTGDPSGYGISISGTCSNIRLTYVDTSGSGRAGLGTWGNISGLYLGHVTAHDNYGIAGFNGVSGSGFELGGVHGGTVEYCSAYFNGKYNTHDGGPVGIWTYESSNVLIQYCESHHNRSSSHTDGGGFDFDGGTTNSVMQFNYSHDNEGSGYLLCQYAGASKWSNNVINGNRSVNDGLKRGAGILIWSDGTAIDRATITGNVIIGNLPFWKSGKVTNLSMSGNVLTVSKQS